MNLDATVFPSSTGSSEQLKDKHLIKKTVGAVKPRTTKETSAWKSASVSHKTPHSLRSSMSSLSNGEFQIASILDENATHESRDLSVSDSSTSAGEFQVPFKNIVYACLMLSHLFFSFQRITATNATKKTERNTVCPSIFGL